MMFWNAASCGKKHILFVSLQTAVSMAVILWLLSPGVFAANTSNRASSARADFLFEKPEGFLGLRFGRFFPTADSDLFDFATSTLTLDKKNFRAWNVGVDGGMDLHERVDLIFSMDYSKRTKNSEFRDFVDDQGLPITQTTEFSQIPITAGIKFLLIPRGRSVGRFSWLPERVVPFVGGGGGALWYRFKQWGDFVEEVTADGETWWEIFPAKLKSAGWAPTVYAGGGADIHIAKGAYVTLDFRYFWANAELSRDFIAFDPIDLSGLRITAGLQWHF